MTPYQRIMRADRLKRGVRLSADDVAKLASDHAIIARAEWDDMERSEEEAVRSADYRDSRLRNGWDGDPPK